MGITSSCSRKEMETLLLSSPKQRDGIWLLLVALESLTSLLILNKGCLFMFYLYIYTQTRIRFG